MATNTPKLLAQIELTGGADTVYTVPASTTTLINNITLTNKTGTDRTADITAGDSGSEMTVRKTLSVLALSTVEFNGVLILEAADVLKMTASAASAIDVLVSGLEQT